MSEAVTTLVPHEKAVLMAVNRRALNDAAATKLVDEVLTAAAANPTKPLVLDMLKVEFTPSAVLGALVRLAQTMKLDGRQFALVRVDRRVRGTLSVTRLDKVLTMHETIDDFIASLPKPT